MRRNVDVSGHVLVLVYLPVLVEQGRGHNCVNSDVRGDADVDGGYGSGCGSRWRSGSKWKCEIGHYWK